MRIDLPDPEAFAKMIENITEMKMATIPTGVSLDSREVKQGDLFVAIKGDRVDGHDYLQNARINGSIAALVTSLNPEVDIPQIKVKNPTAIIAHLAKQW